MCGIEKIPWHCLLFVIKLCPPNLIWRAYYIVILWFKVLEDPFAPAVFDKVVEKRQMQKDQYQ